MALKLIGCTTSVRTHNYCIMQTVRSYSDINSNKMKTNTQNFLKTRAPLLGFNKSLYTETELGAGGGGGGTFVLGSFVY